MAARRLAFFPVLLASLAACQGPTRIEQPVTAQDVAQYQKLKNAPSNLGPIENRGALFISLDQNLRSWRTLVSATTPQDQEQRESFEAALGRLVYNNFDTILEELVAGDAEHRITAAAALGFAPAPGVEGEPLRFPQIPPLVAATEEGDDRLTKNALLALCLIGSPGRGIPVDLMLEILVTHHDPEIRANAGLVLVRILEPEHASTALGMLYAALEDPDPKVRLHAVTAVGRLEDPSSTGRILAMFLEDDSPLVQANAARTLGVMQDDKAVPALIEGLSASYQVIRVSCYVSLKRITGKDLGPQPRPWILWAEQNLTQVGD